MFSACLPTISLSEKDARNPWKIRLFLSWSIGPIFDSFCRLVYTGVPHRNRCMYFRGVTCYSDSLWSGQALHLRYWARLLSYLLYFMARLLLLSKTSQEKAQVSNFFLSPMELQFLICPYCVLFVTLLEIVRDGTPTLSSIICPGFMVGLGLFLRNIHPGIF